jgi:hypothetical protein
LAPAASLTAFDGLYREKGFGTESHWTEDRALIDRAKRFLVKLIRSSEALDPAADHFEPELVPVEYDDAAMAEGMNDLMEPDPYDDRDYDG